ncbi:uncharacterized protein LOC125187180 isoform X2 [Salvia hispanica]|uniref:uncharacterized protein LOC125187180 isoform X2 n=1 Tax=Salvia hispanica TaxID=49212 RepID=UPI0020091DF4|nr:uncharacterized protein LOC125187180 isoform X2 [Salvia hispanica]
MDDELERRRLLHHPLLSPSATATAASSPLDDDDDNNINLISSNSAIFSRLFLVAIIAAVSVWANFEASRGFAITAASESSDAFLASRFRLFYVSNDGAARAAIKASDAIEKLLFSDSDAAKKPIRSIEIKLVDRNFTGNVAAAELAGDRDRFAIRVSSSVMRGADFDREMARAIRRGVARVWLWDGGGHAPRSVVSGIVEYLVDPPRVSTPEILDRWRICFGAGLDRSGG